MSNLIKAAEQRKKEFERRTEKTVQKERESEKGMFDDKEAFVTGAYRQKMLEMQEEEEKERKRQAIEGRCILFHHHHHLFFMSLSAFISSTLTLSLPAYHWKSYTLPVVEGLS